MPIEAASRGRRPTPEPLIKLSAPDHARAVSSWHGARTWALVRGQVAPRANGRALRETLLGAKAEIFEVNGLQVVLHVGPVAEVLGWLSQREAVQIAPTWRVDGIELDVADELEFQLLRLMIVLSSGETGPN